MKPSRQRRIERTSVRGSSDATLLQRMAVHVAPAGGGTGVVKAVPDPGESAGL